jgi:hypothetical protein
MIPNPDHTNSFPLDGKGAKRKSQRSGQRESRGPALWRGPGPARGPVTKTAETVFSLSRATCPKIY